MFHLSAPYILSFSALAWYFVHNGQAGSAFPELLLSGPAPLALLHVTNDDSQDDFFHNLSIHRGQPDGSVVPCILLSALLVDGHHTDKPPVLVIAKTEAK